MTYLSLKEVSRRTGYSVKRVLAAVRAGVIPGTKRRQCKPWRVREEDLRMFLTELTMKGVSTPKQLKERGLAREWWEMNAALSEYDYMVACERRRRKRSRKHLRQT